MLVEEALMREGARFLLIPGRQLAQVKGFFFPFFSFLSFSLSPPFFFFFKNNLSTAVYLGH